MGIISSKPKQNLIINGDMQIAQRGPSFVAPTNGQYTLDRNQYLKNGAMVHTISQDTDVPTFAQAGYLFKNSLRPVSYTHLTLPTSDLV